MRVRWIQNLIWHLRDACGRTKRSFSTLPTHPSSSTSSRGKDSPSVRLTRNMVGENAHCSKRSVRRNWKRLWQQRRNPLSGSRRRRDSFAKKNPSKIGCFQGLWHWDQFTGKSVVTLTPTSKWSMRRRWTQRYLVCADTKFWIRSPEVTEEPWVKFNTVCRGRKNLIPSTSRWNQIVDGIRFLAIVENNTKICIDSLY